MANEFEFDVDLTPEELETKVDIAENAVNILRSLRERDLKRLRIFEEHVNHYSECVRQTTLSVEALNRALETFNEKSGEALRLGSGGYSGSSHSEVLSGSEEVPGTSGAEQNYVG